MLQNSTETIFHPISNTFRSLHYQCLFELRSEIPAPAHNAAADTVIEFTPFYLTHRLNALSGYRRISVFIVNNKHRLKEEFREVTADMNAQMTLPLNPQKSIFHIPALNFYKYDPGVKNEVEYLTHA